MDEYEMQALELDRMLWNAKQQYPRREFFEDMLSREITELRLKSKTYTRPISNGAKGVRDDRIFDGRPGRVKP